MDWLLESAEWLFDGLGTLLIGLAIGGSGGAAGGYTMAKHSVRQKQKAGDNSPQTQIGGNQQNPGGSD